MSDDVSIASVCERACDDARRALEGWQVYIARRYAERALEQASRANLRGLAMHAELLLARVALCVTHDPAAQPTPSVVAPAPSLLAALARWESEKNLASLSVNAAPALLARVEQIAFSQATAVDLLAAWVQQHAALPARQWKELPLEWPADFEDEFGWADLARAISAEASGAVSTPAFERAQERASEVEARSVLAAALVCRAAISAERRAFRQERALRLELVDLVESWSLELASEDAQRALGRPDRARAAGAELVPVTGDARLVRVALSMAEEANIEQLARIALAAAIEESDAERGVLVLRDAANRYHAAQTFALAEQQAELFGFSTTIANQVIDAGEVVATNDVAHDARFSNVKSLEAQVTSVLCVPARNRAIVEGAIYLDRQGRGRPFDESVIAAVSAVGSMLAAALAVRRTLNDLANQADELSQARTEIARVLAARTDEVERLQREIAQRRGERGAHTPLVGKSPAMTRLREAIDRFAPSDAPVFISGETGTGKELVARALHRQSRRHDAVFLAVNCGAFAEGLLESELFGAEKGAYTGAGAAREGLFEAAEGGTLLLDEVGDMPASMQVALLRVLETGDVRRVGGTKSRHVDVRILSASHKDLSELVAQGKFRADLRYRLQVVTIDVPALAARVEDLPELAEHLLKDVSVRYGVPPRTLSRAALAALVGQNFPGNVRELRHVLTSAALTARGPHIEPADFPFEPARPSTPAPSIRHDQDEARAENIRDALRRAGGHRGRAAELLGVSRATFYRHLELYEVDPAEFEPQSARRRE